MEDRYKKIIFLLCSLFVFSVAKAENPPFFSGYVDGSYNYLLNSNEFVSSTNDRLYDLEENGLTLQQVALIFQKLPDQGLGFYSDFIGGRDANELAPLGWNPYFGSQTLAVVARDVHLQYTRDALTFSAGLQQSLMGVEDDLYINNTNFSHSILNNVAEPGQSITLRLTVKPNDQLTLTAGASNGWSTIEEAGRLTTMELGGSYNFNKVLSLSVQYSDGPQSVYGDDLGGLSGVRQMMSVIFTYHATPKLDFISDVDYATQSKALLLDGQMGGVLWKGIAQYVNYKWTDQWATSFRADVFSDRDGFRTGVQQTWSEATVTLAYQMFKSFLLRAETRHDFSNTNAFFTSNHLGTSNHQQSYALEGLYRF